VPLTLALSTAKVLVMDALSLSPETAARLERAARERGQDPAELAGTAIEEWLMRESADFEDACRGIEQGRADFLAGRSKPAGEALEQLRRKYDVSR